MMPPKHLEWMLSKGETAAHKYEILRANDCLSPEALARPVDVTELIEQQMRRREQDLAQHIEATRDRILAPGEGYFMGGHVEWALEQAGCLNERGIEFNHRTLDAGLPIRLPGGEFKECRGCRRMVTLKANFCPECGYDFISCPYCGARPKHITPFCPN